MKRKPDSPEHVREPARHDFRYDGGFNFEQDAFGFHAEDAADPGNVDPGSESAPGALSKKDALAQTGAPVVDAAVGGPGQEETPSTMEGDYPDPVESPGKETPAPSAGVSDLDCVSRPQVDVAVGGPPVKPTRAEADVRAIVNGMFGSLVIGPDGLYLAEPI